MKLERFDIVFDDAEVNPHAVYRPGQLINFKIYLKLTKPVKCRAIYVNLFGNSYVHWTETRAVNNGNRSQIQTVHYNSEEKYMDEKVAIYTPDTQGPSADHHPAGEYVYPVSFQVPPTAPSSFEGSVGRIRYYIKASIDRPLKFYKYTKELFTVIRDFDLNLRQPEEIGPFSTGSEFDVNCCGCFSCCYGKVRVSVALPKRGFVPGEQVHVTGEIWNGSKTDLQSVNLEIYQQCVYTTPMKTRTNCRVVSDVPLAGIARGQSMQLNHLLQVNPVPSSHIEGCNNIRVHYYFRLNADGGCCLSMKKECCELLIGSVPLSSSFGPPPSTAMPQLQQPFVPPAPSYQQCMFGRVEIDKDDGKHFGDQNTWAPSYAYYNFDSIPPST